MNLMRLSNNNIDSQTLFNIGKACYDLNRKDEAKLYLTRFMNNTKTDRNAFFQLKNQMDTAQAILNILNPSAKKEAVPNPEQQMEQSPDEGLPPLN